MTPEEKHRHEMKMLKLEIEKAELELQLADRRRAANPAEATPNRGSADAGSRGAPDGQEWNPFSEWSRMRGS